ncbi:MAG: ABC transporter permease [Anaeroplasmataceae bacterium]|nr:ABC transporter permease [Anaeroplasmataceae bacterium]
MQVCKLFLKIVKKNIGLLILYFAIFTFITIFMISGQNQSGSYNQEKIATYVLVEEETEESKAFLSFLDEYIKKVDLNGEGSVDDALFWDDIDLYIYIPKDFFEKIIKDEEAFTMKSAPDSLEATSVISSINTYLNLVKENIHLGICTKEDALSYTKDIFISEEYVSVSIKEKESTGLIRGVYDMAIYVVSSLLMLIVGLVSFNMRKLDINRRLRMSPYPTAKRNVMLAICYFLISVLFIGFVTVIGICIFPKQMNNRIWLYILNICLFAVTMVFMALFISSLFKSDMAYMCLANVLPLVAAFVCGSFVGIDLLPDATKAFGHIFPNIYIVLGNQYIQTASSFNFGEYLGIVWPCFLFIAIFIAGSVLMTNIIAKSDS